MQIGYHVVGRVGCQAVGPSGRAARARYLASHRILVPEYTTVEPVEYVSLPSLPPRRAPLARMVVMLTVFVVVQVERISRTWQVACAIGRVLWCAIMGRPGRVYRSKQSWGSIWRDGIGIAEFA